MDLHEFDFFNACIPNAFSIFIAKLSLIRVYSIITQENLHKVEKGCRFEACS